MTEIMEMVRITYRNTRGNPGFVTVLLSKRDEMIRKLKVKGYKMIVANPPHLCKVQP